MLRSLPLRPLLAAVARIQELVLVEVVVLVLVKVAFRHLQRLACCSDGNFDEGTKRSQKNSEAGRNGQAIELASLQARVWNAAGDRFDRFAQRRFSDTRRRRSATARLCCLPGSDVTARAKTNYKAQNGSKRAARHLAPTLISSALSLPGLARRAFDGVAGFFRFCFFLSNS